MTASESARSGYEAADDNIISGRLTPDQTLERFVAWDMSRRSGYTLLVITSPRPTRSGARRQRLRTHSPFGWHTSPGRKQSR